ncbi:ectonucleoside triphosphate diphosphohydrolase 6-like isoform X4 [Convolutriloba macropyga]|uniref:ectonucleoside triphosphate diphosphohydrolase 6-like isoform X4 n=2 Tax=Convolutriloba macropyga TaxID=536237 RepID=UPI003F520C44
MLKEPSDLSTIVNLGEMRKRHDSKEEKYMRDRDMMRGERSRGRLSRPLLIIIIVALFLGVTFYGPFDLSFLSLSGKHYVIIIDAGSTGSRIHVFSLKEAGMDGYKLLKDDFYPLEPGLSSYGKDPKKAAESLKPLLDFAYKKVPNESHEQTIVKVKATAGLRILSEEVANNILTEVEEYVKKNYKFKVLPKLAQIMDGTDEGVFAWISLNYFLDNWEPVPMKTAALDLGGGSFQLVFETENPDQLPTEAKGNVHKMPVAGMARNVYVKSYLGLGLKEARVKLLKKGEGEVLSSPCLPEKYTGDWEHGGSTYKIQGSSTSSYDNCLTSVKTTFEGAITPINELLTKDFYAFSYIYDKAKDGGLVSGVEGAVVTVADFTRIAKEACKAQLVDQRFQCLDTVYINYLFSHAFKMPEDFKMHVVKKVNGEEISWALGAAFREMDERKV